MPRIDGGALWDRIRAAGGITDRFLAGAGARLRLSELAGGSGLGGMREALRGRSVLVAADDQTAAGVALIELDGIARRLVLCPPDLPDAQLPAIMAGASVEAVVSDRPESAFGAPVPSLFVSCGFPTQPADDSGRDRDEATEWILFTSGTTGQPKMVRHDLASLAAAIGGEGASENRALWGTFYDIRRYGGLQIFLRALLQGGSLALAGSGETLGDFMVRAGALGVTHISGTPSHWRCVLMSPEAPRIRPRYIRLSGEIVDQTILDRLRDAYPEAGIAHAFASTEAGVVFVVEDGKAGFPEKLIGTGAGGARTADLRIEDGTLRVRSAGRALGYLGGEAEGLPVTEGFLDTGDKVELCGDRYQFLGRKGGIINVGGLKIHPEEVEAVLCTHPLVRMALVKGRKNPITGAIVVADVVLTAEPDDADAVKSDIRKACRRVLPPHKVPADIRFVASLDVAPSGKLVRPNA